MPGMGPAPKPAHERRRRNAPMANTVKLPAGGREGPPPVWPYPGRMTKRETDLWERVWRTPAAAAWERYGWQDTVARYIRVLTKAERKDATAAAWAEARQLEDRLGLNPMAMLRLRWEITEDEVAEVRADRAPAARRLQAVDPKAAAGGQEGGEGS